MNDMADSDEIRSGKLVEVAGLQIPEPDQPPNVSGFTGREAELAYFEEKLENTHLAVITGMPGVGKTALGVRLAQRVAADSKPIFWHTLREGEDVRALIYEIANFLAYHRPQEDGWIWAEIVNQNLASLPAESIFNYILGILPGRSYIFCFDNFQFVDRDPLLNLLLGQLRDKLPGLEIRIIVISQRVPEFALRAETQALKGLSLAETRGLVAARGLQLADQTVQDLHARTGGNAMFLTLVLAALRQGQDPRQLVAHLENSPDIRRYLRLAMESLLSENEKQVMRALAVLGDHPGSRDAIEHILDQYDLRTTLDDLNDKHLLISIWGGAHQVYLQHSTVRDYFYSLIGRREKRALHLRAGAFYEDEGEILEAALHFEKARDPGRAVAMLSAQIGLLINRGKAHALSLRLDQLAANSRELSRQQQIALQQARGEVHEFVGDYEKSRSAYQTALNSGPDDAGRADLLRRVGATYESQGDHSRALAYYLESLERSQTLADEILLARAHYAVGKARYRLHQPMEARQRFEASEAISRRLGDGLLRARINLGLGLLAAGEGSPQEALRRFEQARETFHLLGERRQEARAIGNLGLVYQDLGERQNALAQYLAAGEIFDRLGDMDGLMIALSNIGQIYYQIGNDGRQESMDLESNENFELAIDYYERLAQNARKTQNRPWQVMALTGLAEIFHDLGRIADGMAIAQEALAIAADLEPGRELGFAHLVHGLLLDARGDQAAKAHYERAVPLLEEAGEEEDLQKAKRGLARLQGGGSGDGEAAIEEKNDK
jgi:tetratricopeptide (TPR) repeat protein